ncbi:PsbP-related protein [Patescibacteria group bacterium]
MDTQPESQDVKKAKSILWIGLILIILIGTAIAVYFIFLKGQSINPSNNQNVTVNTNTVTQGDCDLITDSQECYDRQDCLPVDICGCTTTYELSRRCGDEDMIPCLCVAGGFDHCETLDCNNSQVPSVFGSNSNAISNTITSPEWQTYTDLAHGYSIQYPDNYLIKSEADGYVAFDSASIDSPSLSHLHVTVTVEKNSLHKYSLGIKTNSVVNTDYNVVEENYTIDGLDGRKITYRDALGNFVIRYVVEYLGAIYDIEAFQSSHEQTLDAMVASVTITRAPYDPSDVTAYEGATCTTDRDCGALPCVLGECLVQLCDDDSDCSNGTCGLHITPVPGYCTTVDAL